MECFVTSSTFALKISTRRMRPSRSVTSAFTFTSSSWRSTELRVCMTCTFCTQISL